jgi:CSLREA domain-containing protein
MIATHKKVIDHHYYVRTLVTLALLAVMASLLLTQAAKPAYATTTFTVNSTVDASDTNHNDNTCDANLSNVPVCTLRAAIEQANATPGADIIDFDIPGTGVQTIHVNASGYGKLPAITEGVTIDGYTQSPCSSYPTPCSSPNTLAKGTNAKLTIQLDGSAAGQSAVGLYVAAPDVVVKGLVINRFEFEGILVGPKAANTRIEGNFVGTDPSGTKAPGYSGTGVVVWGGATVGGPEPAARNLVSGNRDGIHFYGVGDAAYGNLVGTQKDGKSPLGNQKDGVYIISPGHNDVGKAAPGYANTIAFNGDDGVLVADGCGYQKVCNGSSILSNSVFSNGGLGIDLKGTGEDYDTNVLTPNDAGDGDAGANNLQNHPALSSASKPTPAKTVVKGKLNSLPNTSFEVQFFSDPAGTDEGKKLLGTKIVTTDRAGNVSFTFATTKKVSLGQSITATATNSSTGDTSEFCAPRKVVAS